MLLAAKKNLPFFMMLTRYLVLRYKICKKKKQKFQKKYLHSQTSGLKQEKIKTGIPLMNFVMRSKNKDSSSLTLKTVLTLKKLDSCLLFLRNDVFIYFNPLYRRLGVRSMSNKNLVPSPLYENSYANNRANNAKNFLDKDDILNLIISLNTTRDVNSFVALYGLPREEKK